MNNKKNKIRYYDEIQESDHEEPDHEEPDHEEPDHEGCTAQQSFGNYIRKRKDMELNKMMSTNKQARGKKESERRRLNIWYHKYKELIHEMQISEKLFIHGHIMKLSLLLKIKRTRQPKETTLTLKALLYLSLKDLNCENYDKTIHSTRFKEAIKEIKEDDCKLINKYQQRQYKNFFKYHPSTLKELTIHSFIFSNYCSKKKYA